MNVFVIWSTFICGMLPKRESCKSSGTYGRDLLALVLQGLLEYLWRNFSHHVAGGDCVERFHPTGPSSNAYLGRLFCATPHPQDPTLCLAIWIDDDRCIVPRHDANGSSLASDTIGEDDPRWGTAGQSVAEHSAEQSYCKPQNSQSILVNILTHFNIWMCSTPYIYIISEIDILYIHIYVHVSMYV